MKPVTEAKILYKESLIIFLIILSCFMFALLASPFLDSINTQMNDQLFKLRYAIKGKEKGSPAIIQVNINDDSIKNLNLSHWDRSVYGQLIEILNQAGAKAIVVDIIFQDKSYLPGDDLLVEATCRSGNVYFPVVVDMESSTQENKKPNPLLESKLYWKNNKFYSNNLKEASVLFSCFDDLTQCSRGVGHINSMPDPDGINRRFPVVFQSSYDTKIIPSLALRVACDYLEITEDNLKFQSDDQILLQGAKFGEGIVDDIIIPLDERGQIIINWQAPWKDSFPHLSLEKVLESATNPDLMGQLKNLIGDSIVMVSDVTTRSKDYGPGIFEGVYPLSGIHLNVMNSILTKNFIREQGSFQKIISLIILSVILFLFSIRFKSVALFLSWIGLVVLLLFFNILFFMILSQLIYLAVPITGFVLSFIIVNAYRFFLDERKKIKLESQAELESFRREFMSTIAHEIKTPLSLILGPLDVIGADIKEGHKQIFEMIQRNSNKLLYLINQFLHISRMEGGKIILRTQEEDIVNFLKQKLYNFGYLFNQKTIKTVFAEEVPNFSLYLDMEKIDIIFNNLFLNAYKYTPVGGSVTLCISPDLPGRWSGEERVCLGTDMLNITIKNTGPGIPEEQQDNIFNKYQRGHYLSVDGSGIGLYTAKKYIELHKGNIFLKSRKNKGTEFLIQLPIGRSHLQDNEILEIRISRKDYEQDLNFSQILQNYSHDLESNQDIIRTKVKSSDYSNNFEDRAVILIVEDEPDMRAFIRTILEPYYIVCEAVNGKDAISKAKKINPDLILSDVRMPDIDGLQLLNKLKNDRLTQNIPVILITASDFEDLKNNYNNNITIQDNFISPAEYISKPFSDEILLSRVNNIFTLRNQNKDLEIIEQISSLKNPAMFKEIITSNIMMKMIFKEIETLAPTKAPVLITGETGTGKELIADVVHKLSGLKGNYRAINIAAENTDLISDKLFGHEKGAFTGAEKESDGLLYEARKGTVFLDEIGDMNYDTQVKLLRVLDPGYYQKLGSVKEIKCEARIIAATNRDLWKRVDENKFHQDLYNRFLIKIHIPPLRERRDDLPLLFKHFFLLAAEDFNIQAPEVTREFLGLFKNYSFPNNIRDIKSMVWEAFSKYDPGKGLSLESFKQYMLKHPGKIEDPSRLQYGKIKTINFSGGFFNLDELQDIYIQEVYKKTNYNVAATAQILGREQSVIYKRLKNRK